MNETLQRASMAAACLTALAFTMGSDTVEAAGVTRTKDDCMSAWAILNAGDAGGREAVQGVVRWHPHWKSGAYEPGISQSFALSVFDRRFMGGQVTVAHCGHGATCNALAEAVYKAYPSSGNPVVFCVNDPPHIIDNPQGM